MNIINSKDLKKRDFNFIGSVTEQQAKKLSNKYYCLFTKNKEDLVGEVFGIGNRNVYVYIKRRWKNEYN